MEMVLYLKSVEEAAFSVNGAFALNGDCVKFDDKAVVFITVFPVTAAFSPFTVKLVGCEPLSNHSLVKVVRLSENKFVAILGRLYDCVRPSNERLSFSHCGIVGDFFACVKGKNLGRARARMTKELSDSVDDGALLEFLAPFESVIYDDFSSPAPRFLLIDKDDCAHPYAFSMQGDLIDDITELDCT